MKERASFTFDKETIKIIEKIMKSGKYRNRSHVVEYAIRVLGSLEEKEKQEGKEKKTDSEEEKNRGGEGNWIKKAWLKLEQ